MSAALVGRSTFKAAACGLVMGVVLTLWLNRQVGPYAPELLAGLVIGAAGACATIWLRGHRSASQGFATGLQVSRSMGRSAARRAAKVTRPTLAVGRKTPAAECGIEVGRARKPLGRQRLYATHEDVVLVVGPPRMGKTALFGNAVIDAPGAVVATSTKVDLHLLTRPCREAKGPVWVLNPEAMAGAPSNFKWSPVMGCDQPEVAIERAAYLIAGSPDVGGGEDKGFWENSNAKVLRCYLYAAAVAGYDLADVRDWVNDADNKEALRILESHPMTPAGWTDTLRQVLDTSADKTRESIYLTLQLTFEFMANPAVAAAVLPEPGDEVFSFNDFVANHAALYLLGAHKTHGGMGPLFSALTGYVFEEAKRLSQSDACPGGRLDPPVTMVLDEVANICPVPLAQWTSDAGGRGISLLVAIQSPSQLRERWGEAAAETVWNNSNVTLVLGGLKVEGDLTNLSALCGERDDKVKTHTRGRDSSVSETVRRLPVLSPAEIRQLGKFQALLLHRNSRPVIARIQPVWKRTDVRLAASPELAAAPAWRRKLVRLWPVRLPADEPVGETVSV